MKKLHTAMIKVPAQCKPMESIMSQSNRHQKPKGYPWQLFNFLLRVSCGSKSSHDIMNYGRKHLPKRKTTPAFGHFSVERRGIYSSAHRYILDATDQLR